MNNNCFDEGPNVPKTMSLSQRRTARDALFGLFFGVLLLGAIAVGPKQAAPAPAPVAAPSFPFFVNAPQPLGGTADDTPGVQTAMNAMPDGCCMKFPGGGAVYNISSLKIYRRTAIKLMCDAPADLASLDRSGCTFKYNGVQGDRALIDINWSHRCTIEGIRLDCTGATYPQCVVSIDEWNDPNPPASSTNPPTVTTQATIQDCIIYAQGKTGPMDGIWVSKDSRTNVEFCRILHCNITSTGNMNTSGDAIVSGASYNQKGLVIRECGISWWKNGVRVDNGTVHIIDCFGTGNACDAYVVSTPGPFVMERCRFEQSGMAVLCGNLQDADFCIRHCEWGNLGQNAVAGTQTYAFQLWSRFSHIDGCVFASALPANTPQMLIFKPPNGNPFGRLLMTNNRTGKLIDNSGNTFDTVTQSGNWIRAY